MDDIARSPVSSRMMRAIFIIVFVLAGVVSSEPAWSSDVHVQIRQIQQERAHLKALREDLESRLGQLGRSLKKLDRALVRASSDTRQAVTVVRQADVHLADLTARRLKLEKRVDILKRSMMREAAAAYRYAGRTPLWLDVMFGANVADIPHRQYILSRLMTVQAEHRHEFAQSVADLMRMEQEVAHQRIELDRLRQDKLVFQQQLAGRQKAKRMLWKKMRKDSSLQKQRDAELARQEAALKQLLQGIGSTLLASDTGLKWVPMRKRKGRLPWPIKGRIVAHFHSRPAPGRPRLAGIQLAPRHGRGQVKAIAAGQVRYADWFGGYGLMLIVDHGDGLITVYAHNDALYKNLGDWVEAGDILADAGNTGWVKDVRLYFEVRDEGRPVNPVRWCRK
ncbi:MAG: peptidoglycan DD-metalloendopeptidase family protein [Mariprofundaceae bacterium]|nr:peptidoglycan DD-metalloendopeptidase family protein [Mariprofundaceae bacterium]